MKCIECGTGDTSVSKTTKSDHYVIRYRKCVACGANFKTMELSVDYVVRSLRDAINSVFHSETFKHI